MSGSDTTCATRCRCCGATIQHSWNVSSPSAAQRGPDRRGPDRPKAPPPKQQQSTVEKPSRHIKEISDDIAHHERYMQAGGVTLGSPHRYAALYGEQQREDGGENFPFFFNKTSLKRLPGSNVTKAVLDEYFRQGREPPAF